MRDMAQCCSNCSHCKSVLVFQEATYWVGSAAGGVCRLQLAGAVKLAADLGWRLYSGGPSVAELRYPTAANIQGRTVADLVAKKKMRVCILFAGGLAAFD